jgi:hypothetical protein
MHPTNHDDDATEAHHEAASRVLGVQTEEVECSTSDHETLRRLMHSWGYDTDDATDVMETTFIATVDAAGLPAGVIRHRSASVTNVARSS